MAVTAVRNCRGVQAFKRVFDEDDHDKAQFDVILCKFACVELSVYSWRENAHNDAGRTTNTRTYNSSNDEFSLQRQIAN